MTQDTAEKAREERLRQERVDSLEEIAQIEGAQKKVATALLERSRELEGHLKVAHEFAYTVMGDLAHGASWREWAYRDDTKTVRKEWNGYGDGGITAVNRLMAMAAGAASGGEISPAALSELRTHDDIMSVLRIASYLPGITTSYTEDFAGHKSEEFSPDRLDWQYRQLVGLDEKLTRFDKAPKNHEEG